MAKNDYQGFQLCGGSQMLGGASENQQSTDWTPSSFGDAEMLHSFFLEKLLGPSGLSMENEPELDASPETLGPVLVSDSTALS